MLDRLRAGQLSQEAVLSWLETVAAPRNKMDKEKILSRLAEGATRELLPPELLRSLRKERSEVSYEYLEGRRPA